VKTSDTGRHADTPRGTASRQGGTYALLLYLGRPTELEVGRMGRFSFPKGYYVYLGSAMNGLKGRLARHMGAPKSLHWHIDYLAAHAELVELWWQPGDEKLECPWAALASRAPDATLPVAGFGSSDCSCLSHLVYFPYRPSAKILELENISTLKISHLVHLQ